ncbi:MAG: hypothetical protein ACP5QA_05150 [Phycisphaerae bacterium]
MAVFLAVLALAGISSGHREYRVLYPQIGDAPNTMTGDWRVFGGVFVGTTGRGIFYGCPANIDQNI